METYGLNRAHLAEMVAEKDALVLREGTMQLLEMAHTHSIPFHVFSAGIYDVIHAFFEHTQAYVYNPHVVSNMMAFDAEGNLTGFKGNLVHTLNKNSRVIQNSDSWPRVRDRTNVLLLGDNINDVQMADGLNITDIVNIGFLNDRVERLPQYMERWVSAQTCPIYQLAGGGCEVCLSYLTADLCLYLLSGRRGDNHSLSQ